MSARAIRSGNTNRDARRWLGQCPEPGIVCKRSSAATLMILLLAATMPLAHGGSAAAGDITLTTVAAPAAGAAISLAGRWTGRHHSYSLRAPEAENCGGKPCALTYDIVACDNGWCGIAVTDDNPCGFIGLRVGPKPKAKNHTTFTGKLELAKGAAPFVIEAWFNAPDPKVGGSSSQPRLHIVGDTGGGEMLMMRRSFPFSAEMTRVGDAQCTLEKATS